MDRVLLIDSLGFAFFAGALTSTTKEFMSKSIISEGCDAGFADAPCGFGADGALAIGGTSSIERMESS
jgi:hypothetical protein